MQVDIQRQIATAWVLYAEGKRDEALAAMSAAADAEDKTEKHPVTPGVPKPAREFYAGMLLESGMAKEALVAFEATLKKEPNRLDAYVGAAKAAEKAGDPAKAREYYDKGRRHRQRCRQGPGRRQRRARVPSRKKIVRAHCLLLMALGALAAPARSSDRFEVTGYAGVLGEWELTATVVTEKASQRQPGIRRTLDDEACRLVHAGRAGGEDRGNTAADIDPVVAIEGDSVGCRRRCTYRASLSDSYTGMMECPGRAAVPLELWVK